jgi:zinc protease
LKLAVAILLAAPALAAAAAMPAGPPGPSAIDLPVEELVLDNGMRVLLAPRPGSAMVGAAWAVRRGSGDERAQEAGVAHLVEHLLHQGSARVTASDYARLYTEAGAVGIDALTDRDSTAFFQRIPAHQLELWFWLESDRLLRPALGDVEREKSVIAEERRQRLESRPTGAVEEELQRLLWGEHPYAWPAGGTAAAVDHLSRRAAARFLETHYGAAELTAVLVGDFDADRVGELARRYFGRLPAHRAGCPAQVRILYPTVPAGHPDRAALDVLAGVLSGRGGRLHRHLVLGRGVAFSAGAFHDAGRQGGSFSVEIEAAGNAPTELLVEAWDAELARLSGEPPGPAELERVRNQVTTNAWRGMRDPLDFALRLLVADAREGWRALETWPAEVRRVDVEALQRVAARYLQPGRRVMARMTRETAQ